MSGNFPINDISSRKGRWFQSTFWFGIEYSSQASERCSTKRLQEQQSHEDLRQMLPTNVWALPTFDLHRLFIWNRLTVFQTITFVEFSYSPLVYYINVFLGKSCNINLLYIITIPVSSIQTPLLGKTLGYGGMARKIQDGGSMADVTALVLVPLDRWCVGGPIYVIGMIGRWAWLAHWPQMCCFLPLLHCSVEFELILLGRDAGQSGVLGLLLVQI